MKPRTRKILEDCVHQGICIGHTRAYKHTDNPSDEHILQTIEDAIWLEIDEHFEFDRDLMSELVEGFDFLRGRKYE